MPGPYDLNERQNNMMKLDRSGQCQNVTQRYRTVVRMIDKINKCSHCSPSPKFWIYQGSDGKRQRFECNSRNLNSNGVPVIISQKCASLLIPAVSRKHTGNYTCVSPGNYHKKFVVRVISKSI